MAALLGDALGGASVLLEAARRIAALALVDASLAVPVAKPACEAALGALALRPSSGGEFMYYRPSARPCALLVLCHPSDGPSMCRSLAQIWEDGLRGLGVEVLREELGGPVGQGRSLGLEGAEALQAALTGRDPSGRAVSPEVKRLQRLVEEAQFLIFVHPIFWFDVPSQLKGFEESVLSSGFAFRKLPSHWLLNRAAGLVEKLPVARTLMRRYAAYGLLRDKSVYVTRTQGGPAAGLGIFGHASTSLESALQFCGAHLAAADAIAELDDATAEELKGKVLPQAAQRIEAHCRAIATAAAAAAASATAITATTTASAKAPKAGEALAAKPNGA